MTIQDIKNKWPIILNLLKEQSDIITSVTFNTWIKPLEAFDIDNDDKIIFVSTKEDDRLILDMIKKRYIPLLEAASREVLQDSTYRLELVSEKNIFKKEKQEPKKNNSAGNLMPLYTFENFIVGSNNNLAHAASLAVAEAPAEIYNPLFIHGGVGLGKTHLMQAIAHHIIDTNPDLKVLYVTSEKFTNELIQSIRSNKNSSFRDTYRKIDVLLIDDIQFISGKESAQEEFFNTFNDLYQNNKQIVLTSDKPPKEMETLAERLKTRFSEGLICDIQIPTYETKMAIIDKKTEETGIDFSFEIKDYIANNIKSSIREISGAITKIEAYSKLSRKPITLEMAKDTLKDLITSDEKRIIDSEFIIDIVSEHFNVSKSDLISSKRNEEIAFPRQIAMYLCRQMTQDTLIEIAKKLGKGDHSTVSYAAKKIGNQLLTNQELRNNVDILLKKIDPSLN